MANAIHKRFREKNTAHPSLKVKISITVNGIDDWRINISPNRVILESNSVPI